MAGWGYDFSRHRLIDDSQPRKIAKWCSRDIEENAKPSPIPRINQKPVAEFLVPRLRDKNSATFFGLKMAQGNRFVQIWISSISSISGEVLLSTYG
jgi:hypothetical protein